MFVQVGGAASGQVSCGWGPGPSPTSGVATRGASLASLSVVLLSVSESDSELLSESLELPDPPLAGAAGVG